MNAECTAVGSDDSTYMMVEYDAMMIGGKGGNSGCAGGSGSSVAEVGR